jgi:hypothetical protein
MDMLAPFLLRLAVQRTTQVPFTHARLCVGRIGGRVLRHVPVPVDAAPGGDVVDVESEGVATVGGRVGSSVLAAFGSVVVCAGEPSDDAVGVAPGVSAPRNVHRPLRQIMSLIGCTVTQPFARSNRAPPDAAAAGICQKPFTHVALESGAACVHGTCGVVVCPGVVVWPGVVV